MKNDCVGALAYSLCGRDRKRLFAVVGVRDTDFVLVADGRLRRLDKPKPKRLTRFFICNFIQHKRLMQEIPA